MAYILITISLFIIELVYFRLANHLNIIDKPNQRSSHTQIILRGGGVIFYIGMIFYFLIEGFQFPWFFMGLSIISIISFADDVHPQSFKLRLFVHFVSMIMMFYQWNLFNFPWYFSIFALVGCIGIINAYNFMDGINGITGGYSLVIACAFWYINSCQIPFIDNKLIYILILSLLVFNFFNFRKKARCFAGDVGAVSMAYILVFLLGKLILKTGDFSYLILFVVYGVDSVLTIIHRILLKENIFEAHRKHVFQIMANELKMPHVIVSLFYLILQGIVVIGFFIYKSNPYYYLIVVTLIISTLYILFKIRYFKHDLKY